MSAIAQNLKRVTAKINAAVNKYGRQAQEIQLIAVSKGQPTASILEAYRLGLKHFAENYYQEALLKITKLSALPITWHFIGNLQKNKSKGIAQHFSWVHSVSRLEIALLLNQFRPAYYPMLNICLQVNLDNETTKSGVNSEQVFELATAILSLHRLKLRGLMAIPLPEKNEYKQYLSLLRLKNLLLHLNQQMNLNLDTLSMGMSDDLNAAIRAGSNMLRIGRALFGDH